MLDQIKVGSLYKTASGDIVFVLEVLEDLDVVKYNIIGLPDKIITYNLSIALGTYYIDKFLTWEPVNDSKNWSDI